MGHRLLKHKATI